MESSSISEQIRYLFNKHRKVVTWTFFSLFFLFFFIFGCREPRYTIQATFKHEGTKNESDVSVESLLKNLNFSQTELEAKPFFHSRTILRPVVEELGLQMNIAPHPLRNLSDNIKAECFLPLDQPHSFRFADVIYTDDVPLKLYIRFSTRKNYEVYNQKKQLMGRGILGEPIHLCNIDFTITQTPSNLLLNHDMLVVIRPWWKTIDILRQNMRITCYKAQKKLLSLKLSHRDREFGKEILSDVMKSFQSYLKQENEHIAKAQLKYLSERKKELIEQLDDTCNDYVSYLKSNWGGEGFIGCDLELNTLSNAKQNYHNRLLDLDLELKHFQNVSTPTQDISQLHADCHHILAALQNDRDPDPNLSILQDTTYNLKPALDEIKQARYTLNQTPTLKQASQKNHLKTLKSSLTKQLMTILSGPSLGFSGIDPATSRQLYLTYNQELDQLLLEIKQLLFISEQMTKPNFELSTLKHFLPTSLSPELTAQIEQLSLSLKDSHNWSVKEQDRLRTMLHTQKQQLLDHILQHIDLQKIKAKAIEEKIALLQNSSLNLIHNEKQLIEQKLHDIGDTLIDLPEKWQLEQNLKFKTSLAQNIMKAITELVESKTIDHQLKIIGSKPLEEPFSPYKPKYPYLFFLAIFTAFILTLFLISIFYCNQLKYGFPLTPDAFDHLGILSSSAPISELSPSNLSTLRALIDHIKSPTIALLGSAPHYEENLAHLFHLRNKKVLLITPCTKPGLTQYLEGSISTLPILHHTYFDLVPLGPENPLLPELLAKKLLDLPYDHIIFAQHSPLDTPLAQTLHSYCDQTIITLYDQTPAQIFPFKKNPLFIFYRA